MASNPSKLMHYSNTYFENVLREGDTHHDPHHQHNPASSSKEEPSHNEHGHSLVICEGSSGSCRLQKPVDCESEKCSEQLTVMIFPFIALLIGVAAVPTARKIRVPYTLLLLFVGAGLGALGCATDLGLLSLSLSQWVHLNPPAIFFYVFLAPLIFEAAFNTRWHVFKRLLLPILTAAFVIVMLQVGLIASFQKLIIRTSDWTWYAALMFGAMLSATDPISVTATLKALGASEFLNTLIEGESLVNDGSAFVLFEAFFENTVHEGSLSIGDIVVKVLRLSLGGMLMGIAFGLAALLVLGFLYDEFEVETSLTVIVAFLGFWTAQGPSKLSGVICNVASGLVLSAFGRHLITKDVRGPLHEFWELLSWIANTIVFVHAGVLLIAFTWSCAGKPNQYYDYIHILSYYLYLQVIRMALIFIFRPFMAIGNKWLQWKEAFVVGFSGLRGAVSLVMALEVSGAHISSNVKTRVVLWTTGVVALSLLVNGFFIQPIIRLLGLDKAKKSREDFLNRGRLILVQRSLMILDALCIDTGFKAARWSYVVKNILPEKWLNDDEDSEGYQEAWDHIMDATITSNRESLRHGLIQRRQQNGHSEVEGRLSLALSMASLPNSPRVVSRASIRSSAGLTRTEAPFEFEVDPNLFRTAGMTRKYPFPKDKMDSFGSNARPLAGQPERFGAIGPNTANRLSITADIDRYRNNSRPVWRGHIRTQARIQSEMVREHQRTMPNEFAHLSEEDQEVQRRLLTAILSHLRALSNSCMVEFNVLHSLEKDCQLALDANEEGKDYNLFSFLDTRRRKQLSPLYHGYLWTIEGHELRGQTAITTAFVVFGVLTEILKADILESSTVVQMQAEQLYEGAAALLNRLETLNPRAFEWVQSQFAVYVSARRQDEVLHDMLEGGIIDHEEYKVLRNDIVSVRRQHFQTRQSLFFGIRSHLPPRPEPKQLLREHAIFSNLPSALRKSVVDRHGELIELASGETLNCQKGSLVLVLEGALRPLENSAWPIKMESSRNSSSESESSDDGSDTSHDDIAPQLFEMASTMTGCRPLTTGAETHWCFTANSSTCGPEVALSVHRGTNGKLCSIAQERTSDIQLRCCDTARSTTVFTLPARQVCELAKDNFEFRMEITRAVARDIVLDSVTDESPYRLSHFTESLSSNLDVNTVIGRAFRVLERLPYMRVIDVYGEQLPATYLQGPGVLLNGTVRVSLLNTNGMTGTETLIHEALTGPALLPAGEIMVEAVKSPEALDNAEGTLKGPEHTMQNENVNMAHILVEPYEDDMTAVLRRRRWTAPAGQVDMNGRFGMNRHIEFSSLTSAKIE